VRVAGRMPPVERLPPDGPSSHVCSRNIAGRTGRRRVAAAGYHYESVVQELDPANGLGQAGGNGAECDIHHPL
jgi:hypothetical protein